MSTIVKAMSALIVYAAGSYLTAQSLAQHAREVEMAVSLYHKPVPKWENGLMLLYQYDVQPPEVSIFNNEGRMLMKASIVVPEAARVWIEGTAASSEGTVVVAGPAMKTDGAVVASITWLTNKGNIERVVRTSPFAARRLCFASDGTLWAVGRERSEDGTTEPPHNILRHYDKNGQMIGSFLPSTDFTQYNQEPPAEDSFLMATTDRIGLYSASSRVFVELDYSGRVMGRWNGLVSDRNFEVTGVGMLRGGSTYLSGRRKIPGPPGSAPEYFVLDKQKSTWTRLDAAGLFGSISGAQDDQLIFANGGSRFVWIAAK
jgi:hypothetical protein